MSIVQYLPSTQFTVIVGSILISGGLVVAAQQITKPPSHTPSVSVGIPVNPPSEGDWLAALQAVEGPRLATTSDQSDSQSAQGLLDAAASSNITDTVGRTLLVSLGQAASQGLGSDIPTQDSLVAQAVAQIPQGRAAPTYSNSDLTLSANTPDAQKAYGNAFMSTIALHTKASYNATVLAIGTATDNNNPAPLSALPAISKDYSDLARDLSKVPVPPVLAPIHLQIINTLAQMAGTYGDIQVMFTDPLRALAGFQLYDALNNEALRLFINTAQEFSQNSILFNKDEAGYAWPLLLSQQSQ